MNFSSNDVQRIYLGSNGEETAAFYKALGNTGALGIVALNLFRAQKCSARAKVYRRRAHKAEAYGRKQWSMDNLCQALTDYSEHLEIRWGWQRDPEQPVHSWVLYLDLPPSGQVSFHTETRGAGPDYDGSWDHGSSEQTMLNFVRAVVAAVHSETVH